MTHLTKSGLISVSQLLAKSPDQRYQSAYGVKADLLECQRLLLAAVHTGMESDMSEVNGIRLAT